jgi:hypothetical protein
LIFFAGVIADAFFIDADTPPLFHDTPPLPPPIDAYYADGYSAASCWREAPDDGAMIAPLIAAAA